MSLTSQANREWKEEAARRQAKLETSRNIPSRFAGGPLDDIRIRIDRGNVLDTDQLGIKYADPPIDEVPAAYDADTDESFIDGVGRGRLQINGELQDGYVLVINDARSSFGHALLGDNDDTDGPDTPAGLAEVSVPVAGGGAVTMWIVG